MIKGEIRKSRRALETAMVDLKAGDGAASINRSYYAMFYAARAMLRNAGQEIPKTHSALISDFSKRFVNSGVLARQLGRDFNKIEEQRRYVDYIADEEISLGVASEILDKAKAFVDAADALVSRDTSE